MFVQELYDTADEDKIHKIMALESQTHIPLLDDPINNVELNTAWNDMKKSAYDYNLPNFGILLSYFSLIILMILNLLFYFKYPISLACSLLTTIPKKGNLLMPKNYRGIQMMRTLACCLFDRILDVVVIQ